METLRRLTVDEDALSDEPATIAPEQLHSSGAVSPSGLNSYTQSLTEDGLPYNRNEPEADDKSLVHAHCRSQNSTFQSSDNVATVEENENPAAFARLEFEDGDFYLNTYFLRLGRDLRAARVAARQHIGEVGINSQVRTRRPSSFNDVPQTPQRASASAPRSHLSESGGIVGVGESPSLHSSRSRRKKSHRSKSTSSSSRYFSQLNPTSVTNGENTTLQALDLSRNPHNTRASASQYQPNPWENPLLPIHPPKGSAGPYGGFKGISREHAMIEYDFEHDHFNLKCIGRNGLFHDGKYYGPGDSVPLHHRSSIQIGNVPITFVLPDRDTVSQRSGSSSKINFTFENGRGENIGVEESSDSDSGRETLFTHTSDWDVPEDEESENRAEGDRRSDSSRGPRPKKQTLKIRIGKVDRRTEEERRKEAKSKGKKKKQRSSNQKENGTAPQEISVRRHGKESSRSKLKHEPKQKKENEKVEDFGKNGQPDSEERQPINSYENAEESSSKEPPKEGLPAPEEYERYGIATGTIIPKRKGPGRPPKDGIMSKREKALLLRQAKEAERARKLGLDPSQIPPPISRVKAASKPRKESEAGSTENLDKDDIAHDGESSSVQVNNEGNDKRSAKAAKPPRSPSPEVKESDFTEEQLQRPVASYVILIHEAISNSPSGAMNLQQIYSAIERRYPFFKFKTGTFGWQSSVRHNLNQHDAFQKKERDGKGFLWTINPSVSIEREKRRRATPPPSQPSPRPYYPPPHQYQLVTQGGAPPGYSPYPPPGQVASPYSLPPGHAPPGPPAFPQISPSLGGAPPTERRRSTYSSPYATNPNPSAGHISTPNTTGSITATSQGPPPPAASYHRSPYLKSVGHPYHPAQTATSNSPLGQSPSQQPASHGHTGQPDSRTSGSPKFGSAGPPTSNSASTGPQSSMPAAPHLSAALQRNLDEFKTIFIQEFSRGSATNVDGERVINNAMQRVLHPEMFAGDSLAIPQDEQIVVQKLRLLLGGGVREQPSGQASQASKVEGNGVKSAEAAANEIKPQTLADIAFTAAAETVSSTLQPGAHADAPPKLSEDNPNGASAGTSTANTPHKSADMKHPSSRPLRAPSVEPLTPVTGSPSVNGVTNPTAKRTAPVDSANTRDGKNGESPAGEMMPKKRGTDARGPPEGKTKRLRVS